MTVSEFKGPDLTDTQWEHVKALVSSLDSKQLLWISGFLAGFEQASSAKAAPTPSTAQGKSGAGPTRRLTVLYGSETGNSRTLAKTLAERAAQRGLAVSLHDMVDYKPRQLKDEQDVLIVASTYGEGDPPQTAADFFEFIEGRKAPKLPTVRFGVLAIGDSSYERYCEAGKRLDRRFEELGAQRLAPRVDCDVDYEEAANAWIDDVLDILAKTAAAGDSTTSTASRLSSVAATPTPAIDKHNPHPARVIENIVLSGRGSSKETRHIELSLEGSGIHFEPGDALGLVPTNDPALVEGLLCTLKLDASTTVDIKGKQAALGEAVASHFEITTLTPRFLDRWAELSGAQTLRNLAASGHVDERAAYLSGHHIIDVIRQFPVEGLDAATFAGMLRPLQPRLYSIASSLAAAPEEVHLTVATVRYELHGERRAGVASGQLSDRVALDAKLPVYVHRNPNFRLPGDDVPIIMIGAGTGVAPFRAFMQEREARGANGRSWLFFGDRHFRTDFLYQTEWQRLLKDKLLTRMDVAFSRDRRSDGEAKAYVQHRLKAHARDVFAWLEEGAHLYVCGDAKRLAPDVHRTLAEIVAKEGGFGPEATQDYLHKLQRERRYQRDVY
ncbi:assimilatory sulfite reductase (NADPH) flavoprotein subunit [Trinickia sp. EG282A]|uniref:assimilatory sulfite reductase (NADPH) flavoprotein subunit n=1 Tax=Trinickia sp. EG282A TaxID=3237013 RepID=UPI0034D1C379